MIFNLILEIWEDGKITSTKQGAYNTQSQKFTSNCCEIWDDNYLVSDSDIESLLKSSVAKYYRGILDRISNEYVKYECIDYSISSDSSVSIQFIGFAIPKEVSTFLEISELPEDYIYDIWKFERGYVLLTDNPSSEVSENIRNFGDEDVTVWGIVEDGINFEFGKVDYQFANPEGVCLIPLFVNSAINR